MKLVKYELNLGSDFWGKPVTHVIRLEYKKKIVSHRNKTFSLFENVSNSKF